MADRRSDKHSPRVDDEMRHDVSSMLQGSSEESRAQEQRVQEGPDRPDLPQGELDLRSELAKVLRPSAFPGNRARMLGSALGEQASDRMLNLVRNLPEGETFEHFEDVWEKVRAAGAA